MDKKYYAIHFNFSGIPLCIPIEKETLEKDANGVEDYWGEFACHNVHYQFQLHYNCDEVIASIFLKGSFSYVSKCSCVITRYVIGQQIYKGRKSSEKPTILF